MIMSQTTKAIEPFVKCEEYEDEAYWEYLFQIASSLLEQEEDNRR